MEYENFHQNIYYLVDLKDGKFSLAIESLLGTSTDHGESASLEFAKLQKDKDYENLPHTCTKWQIWIWFSQRSSPLSYRQQCFPRRGSVLSALSWYKLLLSKEEEHVPNTETWLFEHRMAKTLLRRKNPVSLKNYLLSVWTQLNLPLTMRKNFWWNFSQLIRVTQGALIQWNREDDCFKKRTHQQFVVSLPSI